MDRPTVSSQDSGSSSRCWDDPPTARTRHHWARTRGVSERLRTRDATTWIPSKEEKKRETLKTSNGKCSRWEENVLVWRPFWTPYMSKDTCFFSCLASLSGFLKDAKSVYLKRLLACVKRRLTLYIRLLFYFTLSLFVRLFSYSVFFFFKFHMNYKQVLMFYFCINYLFRSRCFVQKGSFMKKCGNIRAQISSLLHVFFKCVCTCIFVCVWIYV